jgi:hypothetical protein
MSVEKAAKGLVSGGTVSEGVLNMVEMAFRACDPCLGCATHSLPGSMPLLVRVRTVGTLLPAVSAAIPRVLHLVRELAGGRA